MKQVVVVVCALVLMTAIVNAQVSPAIRGGNQVGIQTATGIPSDCSLCLWYSGDSDPGSLNWDGLFNANAAGQGLSGRVYVPFIPAPNANAANKHVLISSVTFNLLVTTSDSNPPADFAGMTYEFRKGQVMEGIGGTLGKHGNCSFTTIKFTQPENGYNEYSFTCHFTTPVKVAVGTIQWVSLYPKFTGSSYAYLSGATDIPGNQFGWSNDLYNSFFTSTTFGANFNASTGFGPGFQGFSVAIAGTYTL